LHLRRAALEELGSFIERLCLGGGEEEEVERKQKADRKEEEVERDGRAKASPEEKKGEKKVSSSTEEQQQQRPGSCRLGHSPSSAAIALEDFVSPAHSSSTRAASAPASVNQEGSTRSAFGDSHCDKEDEVRNGFCCNYDPPSLSLWRSEMSDWSLQVSDHYGFDPEIVSMAFSMLDRSIPKLGGYICEDRLRLLCATALYCSVKAHDPGCQIPPSAFAEMSRGSCTESGIIEAELWMLGALGWRINPPTSLSFVRSLLDLLPPNVTAEQREEIESECRDLTELALADSDLIPFQESSVAISSIMLAFSIVEGEGGVRRPGMDCCGDEGAALEDGTKAVPCVSPADVALFISNVERFTDIDVSCNEVFECTNRLEYLYLRDDC